MDANRVVRMMTEGSGRWTWTEERHVSFLNWLEESLVWGSDFDGAGAELNRLLPDSATESNRDAQRRPAGVRFADRETNSGRSDLPRDSCST
ncbi:hypothetical protein Cni_G26940 [Canna indica]|uniref:Uncharacterized protein n=1 Tax=Canna indica TaxID=4628 RepID=A0AAQ3KZZ0_9LILI|nr:hypothetical protein Cni_G26940 [Canna indica]